jgi:hypothetical protein
MAARPAVMVQMTAAPMAAEQVERAVMGVVAGPLEAVRVEPAVAAPVE